MNRVRGCIILTLVSIVFFWMGIDGIQGKLRSRVGDVFFPVSNGELIFTVLAYSAVLAACWYLLFHSTAQAEKTAGAISQAEITYGTVTPPRYEGGIEDAGATIVSGVYKYEGWKYRIVAVIYSFLGSVISLLGLLLLMFIHAMPLIGLTFIVLGGLLLFEGRFYWKRSKPLTKGKLY